MYTDVTYLCFYFSPQCNFDPLQENSVVLLFPIEILFKNQESWDYKTVPTPYHQGYPNMSDYTNK